MGIRNRRLEQAVYQNDIWSRQYRLLQKAYTDNAMLFHDMDHHLQTIWHLAAQEGNTGIMEYISGIREPLSELSGILWTGVGIVDAVLNVKKELAEEKGFCLDIDAELPANTGIDAGDFCAILGNLLDNAIESMERQEAGGSAEPIRVSLRRINHFLMIQVSNPCREQCLEKRGPFRSLKADAARHGWGLKSVKRAVLKYGGSFLCGMEDGRFVATAMLFFVPAAPGTGGNA